MMEQEMESIGEEDFIKSLVHPKIRKDYILERKKKREKLRPILSKGKNF